MASTVTRGFLQPTPVIYRQLRFAGNRPNIQRPKPPFFLKNKFLTVCKPTEIEDRRLPIEKCLKREQLTPPYDLDALDKIYAAEVRDLFKTSKLSAVFSRSTFCFDELHQARILLFKANMKVLIRNKYIVNKAIGDTEFRNLLPLFEASTFMVFSEEDDISKLVQIDQKLPLFHLLCAVVDGRILSMTQLRALAAIPNINTARSGVVQTLQSGAQSVAQSLQSHQNTLVQQLKHRADQLQSS